MCLYLPPKLPALSSHRVSKASVLIVDVGTMVAHEVAKNLTLAGIRELWLLELDKDVKAAEHRFIDQRGACLFFQRPTDSVKEDVKLMADKLKMLNPNLVVTLPATVTAVDLKAIDMLICCSTSYETAVNKPVVPCRKPPMHNPNPVGAMERPGSST